MYRESVGSIICLLWLVVMFGMMLVSPYDVSAKGRRPVTKAGSKASVSEIKPGLRFEMDSLEIVRLVNPEPVSGEQTDPPYGSQCSVHRGWSVEAVGTERLNGHDQVLLRVVAMPEHSLNGCPVGSLFFLSVRDVKETLSRIAKRQAEEAAEKDAVRRLLEEPK